MNWPAGVGARGSSGVSGVVSRTPGAVGYADIAYSLKNHLKFFSVQNRAKKFARPGLAGIRAASLADRKFSPTNELSIVNPPGGKRFVKAYPICTYTYVILRIQSDKANLLKPFVTWALTTGQQSGPPLIFQPIPKIVVARGKATLKKVHSRQSESRACQSRRSELPAPPPSSGGAASVPGTRSSTSSRALRR